MGIPAASTMIMRALKLRSCTAISRAAGVVQKPMSKAVPLPTSSHGRNIAVMVTSQPGNT
jgi:hypothetical protein